MIAFIIYSYILILGFLIITRSKDLERRHLKCQLHDWIRKGEEGNTYLTCSRCGLISGTDDLYEEDIEKNG